METVRKASQVIYRLIENENYDLNENGELRVLQLLRQSGKVRTILDVGANIGEYTRIAAQLFPNARIHSFEPVERTFKILGSAVSNLPNVSIHAFGLSDQDADAEFFIQPKNLGVSSSLPRTGRLLNPSSEIAVERCLLRHSLAAVSKIGLKSIDFLKIDTEGNDWFVLNGFSEWLATGRIAVIQFEYGLACIETKKLLTDYYDLLAPKGYRIGKIFPTFVDFRDYHPVHEDFIGPNYIAVHENSGLQQLLA